MKTARRAPRSVVSARNIPIVDYTTKYESNQQATSAPRKTTFRKTRQERPILWKNAPREAQDRKKGFMA